MKGVEDFIKELLNVKASKFIVAFLIVFISILVNKFIINYIFKVLNKVVNKTQNFLDDNFTRALEKPLKFFIFFCGVYYALRFINIDGFNINGVSTVKIIRVGAVISICYFLYNLTLENSLLYSRINKKNKSNTIVFPFISIITRLFIMLLCIVIIANEFEFTGFIAGLGISGVAFALVAQDAFSNLFGGMIIVLDKPFAIGDWIQTTDIEGIVEEITFRSTKIRTFSMALATVPNSKLANTNIINWTQRNLRRIHFKFTIEHDTEIQKIKNSVDKIEEVLKGNPKIDNKLIIVSFNELSTYGFGIFVYFYTTELDYGLYEKLKQEVNISVLEILREEKIELMFLNLNFKGFENRGSNCEVECTELESIKNITEEERGE